MISEYFMFIYCKAYIIIAFLKYWYHVSIIISNASVCMLRRIAVLHVPYPCPCVVHRDRGRGLFRLWYNGPILHQLVIDIPVNRNSQL